MKPSTRFIMYALVFTIWLISGIAYGFREIVIWGVFAAVIIIGYEVILTGLIRKKK